MKPNIIALIGCLSLLGACSKPEPAPATDVKASTTPAQAATPAPQGRAPKVATAERIQEIEASGQTGLWASVTEVCPKDVKLGLRTTLTWNVKDQGAEGVVIYGIDIKKVERRLGKGGPVGEVETGPWLRPGVSFNIRDVKSDTMLGSVEIGEKAC